MEISSTNEISSDLWLGEGEGEEYVAPRGAWLLPLLETRALDITRGLSKKIPPDWGGGGRGRWNDSAVSETKVTAPALSCQHALLLFLFFLLPSYSQSVALFICQWEKQINPKSRILRKIIVAGRWWWDDGWTCLANGTHSDDISSIVAPTNRCLSCLRSLPWASSNGREEREIIFSLSKSLSSWLEIIMWSEVLMRYGNSIEVSFSERSWCNGLLNQ